MEQKNNVVKRYVYNANIKNIEDKIPDITTIATNNTLNAKINEVKNKIPSITNLASDIALTVVDIANFVKKADFDNELKNLNKNLTSNKTKHVLVENELNEL